MVWNSNLLNVFAHFWVAKPNLRGVQLLGISKKLLSSRSIYSCSTCCTRLSVEFSAFACVDDCCLFPASWDLLFTLLSQLSVECLLQHCGNIFLWHVMRLTSICSPKMCGSTKYVYLCFNFWYIKRSPETSVRYRYKI